MKTLIALLTAATLAHATEPATAHTAAHKQSGRAKAYTGPAGELITMIPLDQNTKMLVHTYNTHGVTNERVLIYELRDGPTPQVIFKRAQQPENGEDYAIVLYKTEPNANWKFHDYLENKWLSRTKDYVLTYSKDLSANIDARDLIARAKDFQPPTEQGDQQ